MVEDGAPCRAGQLIAYCVVGPQPNTRGGPALFEGELLHAALAAPASGVLRHAPDASRGGFMDLLDFYQLWRPDDVVGAIEVAVGQPAPPDDVLPRLTITAGRRVSGLGNNRRPLMSWTSRDRAWRVEGDGPIGTLLSTGICEQVFVMKGDGHPFTEVLDAATGPAQVVFTPDQPLAPCARNIIDRIQLTAEQHEAMARDVSQGLLAGPITPGPADLIFAGAMLDALRNSPVTARYDILTREGLRVAGPPDAVVLSVLAEAPLTLRHRRLGYGLHAHDFMLHQAGPAMNAWLRANFEQVERGPDDILADYLELIDVIQARAPGTRILICNVMSTNGWEDMINYDMVEAPLGRSLSNVRAKDLNLALHDLASQRDIAIVDTDAIAADMGGQRCLPDGTHQNGELQTEIRAEILRILRARNTPGFA
jgi:hypothetical protein